MLRPQNAPSSTLERPFLPPSLRHRPEDHLIFRQGASFIREDHLDLAQVFGDVESAADHRLVLLFVVQISVLSDEVYLTHLDKLQGDVERYGDENLKNDHVGQKGNDASVESVLLNL